MKIEWDVPIKMDDDLVLRADVYRPPIESKFPIILTYGPYGKGLAFQKGYPQQWERMVREHPDVARGSSNKYQSWEVVDPEKWVPSGYACVRVDSRGAGRSPGHIDPYSPRETKDLYNCIEWAGVQPWSSGKVGLLGISYFAINQWLVAAKQPPHLSAIIPWEGANDTYRDIARHGGILCTFRRNWFGKQVMTVQHGIGSRGSVNPNTGEFVGGPETLADQELLKNRTNPGEEYLSHKIRDDFYAERSSDLSKVVVPLLSCANWGGQGLHTRGNFEGFVRAASREKWLEVHGLEHWTEFYTDYGVGLQKKFFDHFLKGLDNDWKYQPRVLLNVRTINGFEKREENEWPLARTLWTKYYLDPSTNSLLQEPSYSSEINYDTRGEGLTFLTPPLEQETEITGPSAAKIFISSSTIDADMFLVLRVFAPDGKEVVFQGALDPHTPIGQGWLRASHRKLDPTLSTPYRPWHSHDQIELLVPKQKYELDVEIIPTCIVVPKHYRIALTIRGKDYEYAGESSHLSTYVNEMKGCGPFLHNDLQDRPPEIFNAEITIHSDKKNPSYILLPIIPQTNS
jgi:predicted acyl esterase